MEALKAIIPHLITLSLAGLVFAVGLNSTRHDIMYVLKRPAELFKAVLAVIVIPPIIAGIVVSLLPLPLVVKAGIVLMAVSPVPPLVPGNELAVGARKEYAYGLYVAMALLTIISVPIVFSIASAMFGRGDFVTVRSIAQTVLIGVIFPLVLGLVIRRFAPHLAERSWQVIYKLSMFLVVLAFVPVLLTIWPALMELVGNGTLFAMGLVTALCLAVGHMLGGPDRRDRATLALASSIRHPGISMAIAGSQFHDNRVSAAILLFMVWGLVISAPYKAWIKRGARAQARHA